MQSFFHLYDFTKENRHLEFAYFLLHEIIEDISTNFLLINHESGLSGIGTGIMYLMNNSFVENNSDEILTDIDERVFFSIDSIPFKDFTIEKGLGGLRRYLLFRLCCSKSKLVKKTITEYLIKIDQIKHIAKMYSLDRENTIKTDDIRSITELVTNNEFGLYKGLSYKGLSILNDIGYEKKTG